MKIEVSKELSGEIENRLSQPCAFSVLEKQQLIQLADFLLASDNVMNIIKQV